MLLSNREKEILKLILAEYSSTRIAQELEISVRTVDTHRKNISRKIQSKSLIGLTKYAIKEGMIKDFSWNPNIQG
jgi:NarL family two-component system response regulator LiaR